jgi:hypothetical protein
MNPNDVSPGHIKVMTHQETFGEEFGLRAGTRLHPVPMEFVLTDAGMGDFICFSSAILWLAQNTPWVRGTLYAPKFLLPFLERILKKHRHWRVRNGEQGITGDPATPLIGPNLMDEKGVNLTPQLINATGAHLVDLGFIYYANMQKAPPGVYYPKLHLTPQELPPEVSALRGRYVVFTPGSVTSSRTVLAKHLNPLIDYVLERGLTPVFLGKGKFSSDNIITQFDPNIAYGKGVNLINRTDLFQAASIMENAACVLGLDNGLLHLASCTNAKIIFGYNIAGPEFREPRRNWGHTVNLTVPRSQLACIHCQDRVKMLATHSFHFCLYGDTLCIDMLFENEGERWKKAIDYLLPLA